MDIPVFIVEDHHDVLPFYWQLCRARRMPLGACQLLHFDSHPDLSVPAVGDTSDWADLPTLYYDTLSSEGCIAEFLLPMLHQGIIGECVWVRQEEHCCQLLANEAQPHDANPADPAAPETLHFLCGTRKRSEGSTTHADTDPNIDPNAETEVVRGRAAVSLHRPYYLDEGASCDVEELEDGRPVRVTLSCLAALEAQHSLQNQQQQEHQHQQQHQQQQQQEQQGPWCLDICLDFFLCLNPFLPPVRAALEADLRGSPGGWTADEGLEVLIAAYRDLDYRNSASPSCLSSPSPDNTNTSTSSNTSSTSSSDKRLRDERDDALHALHSLLASPHDDKHDDKHTHAHAHALALAAQYRPASPALRLPLLLPLLSEETRMLVRATGFCLLLPHFPSSDTHQHSYIHTISTPSDTAHTTADTNVNTKTTTNSYSSSSVSALLQRMTAVLSSRPPPVGISIALSIEDGYTPQPSQPPPGTEVPQEAASGNVLRKQENVGDLKALVLDMVRCLARGWGRELAVTDITAGGAGREREERKEGREGEYEKSKKEKEKEDENGEKEENEEEEEEVCVDGYTASIGLFRSDGARGAVRLSKRPESSVTGFGTVDLGKRVRVEEATA